MTSCDTSATSNTEKRADIKQSHGTTYDQAAATVRKLVRSLLARHAAVWSFLSNRIRIPFMSYLQIYLNDHLAGSVAALDLIEHLIGASKDAGLSGFFVKLRDDIDADQDVLKALLQKLGVDESSSKKALAWLVEKLGRIKLQLMEEDNAPGLHQALEGLSLGIMGKRALWRSLASSESALPELQGFDYALLERRATDQFNRVEAQGLKLASLALSSD